MSYNVRTSSGERRPRWRRSSEKLLPAIPSVAPLMKSVPLKVLPPSRGITFIRTPAALFSAVEAAKSTAISCDAAMLIVNCELPGEIRTAVDRPFSWMSCEGPSVP